MRHSDPFAHISISDEDKEKLKIMLCGIAASPLDGRYLDQLKEFAPYTGEMALFYYRTRVEIDWMIFLAQESVFSNFSLEPNEIETLKEIKENLNLEDYVHFKTIEKRTNHDVKAVELFIKEKLESSHLQKDLSPYIHVTCTSEDISNLAHALCLSELSHNVILPKMRVLLALLEEMANKYSDIFMAARTHGQLATPTSVGKEFRIFAERLREYLNDLERIKLSGKFNGATGNLNAHIATTEAMTDRTQCNLVDRREIELKWLSLSKRFVESYGLTWKAHTTQIEPHDSLVKYLEILAHCNRILVGFARDMWIYTSRETFSIERKAGETGSSTMPHKINPIDFENAEGNLNFSNAIGLAFINSLPISREQRDLTDSTLQRNLNVTLEHAYLGFTSLIRGTKKLVPNLTKIKFELAQHPELLGELIQTVMRVNNVPNAYDCLKALTRGECITQAQIQTFVSTLAISDTAKEFLMVFTPSDYVGAASYLAKHSQAEIEKEVEQYALKVDEKNERGEIDLDWGVEQIKLNKIHAGFFAAASRKPAISTDSSKAPTTHIILDLL